mmetsp:Transcript_70130/g.195080  ORF Transcript_70130/g.195080 Transcript_70130/m.195080 type:complete len:342 (+) Transcript_70130:1230-2255(+)
MLGMVANSTSILFLAMDINTEACPERASRRARHASLLSLQNIPLRGQRCASGAPRGIRRVDFLQFDRLNLPLSSGQSAHRRCLLSTAADRIRGLAADAAIVPFSAKARMRKAGRAVGLGPRFDFVRGCLDRHHACKLRARTRLQGLGQSDVVPGAQIDRSHHAGRLNLTPAADRLRGLRSDSRLGTPRIRDRRGLENCARLGAYCTIDILRPRPSIAHKSGKCTRTPLHVGPNGRLDHGHRIAAPLAPFDNFDPLHPHAKGFVLPSACWAGTAVVHGSRPYRGGFAGGGAWWCARGAGASAHMRRRRTLCALLRKRVLQLMSLRPNKFTGLALEHVAMPTN